MAGIQINSGILSQFRQSPSQSSESLIFSVLRPSSLSTEIEPDAGALFLSKLLNISILRLRVTLGLLLLYLDWVLQDILQLQDGSIVPLQPFSAITLQEGLGSRTDSLELI